VYGKCLGFSKSPEEAQDMTHDIFVQLFVKLKSFKGKSKFSTWLYAFTYNFCLNYLQRKLNKSKETFTELNEEYHGAVNEPEVSDAEIFEMKVDKLSKALELINPDEKALLLMKYQDDFSIQDIILALDIGESAVKMRLKRAKSKLINFYHSLD
jgi:RNA polymerase sigma factor (sigma-70 family)